MERVKILSLLPALLLFCGPLIRAQVDMDNPRVANWSGGYFSAFYLIEAAPESFKEFDSIAVEYLSKQKDDEEMLLPDGLVSPT